MKKFSFFSQKTINVIFSSFIIMTLFSALMSPNLTLGDTLTKATIGERTTWVSIVFLLVVISLILVNTVNKKFRKFWYFIFITHGRYAGGGVLALAFGFQIILIFSTHPGIGFDPGAIHDALINPNDNNLRTYFSLNTNNLPILLVQHKIAEIFGGTSWLLFDLINVGLVGLTVFFDTIIVVLINVKKIASSFYIHAAWLFVFPMTLVPYTDLMVLPLVSLLLLCYVIITRRRCGWVIKLISSILMGLTLSGIYFIKPSAIIPMIAIVLITVLYLLAKQTKISKIMFLWIGVFIVSCGISYQTIKTGLAQQDRKSVV